MGCFPEKTNAKYEQFTPQKQVLLKKYAEKHPDDSSIHIPISTADIDAKNTKPRKQSPRSSPRKAAATPVKNRKYYRGPARRLTVQERKYHGESKQRKLKRKNNGDTPEVRKKGKVIELPFRPHVITSIETPSESARSSLLSKLQHHPSLFFLKLGPEGEGELSREKDRKQSEQVMLQGDVNMKKERNKRCKTEHIETVHEQFVE